MHLDPKPLTQLTSLLSFKQMAFRAQFALCLGIFHLGQGNQHRVAIVFVMAATISEVLGR